jgi:hypothetical protein
MKYLKKYKIFESISEEDIKDILLELSDKGWSVSITDPLIAYSGESSNIRAILVKGVNRMYQEVNELTWSELKDYALRLKDYLGDNFESFMWRPFVRAVRKGENPYYTVDLNEDTQIDRNIWSFVIKYKI